MGELIFSGVSNFLNRNRWWLFTSLQLFTGISAAFVTFQMPDQFMKEHPEQVWAYGWILKLNFIAFFIFSILLILYNIFNELNQKTILKLEADLSEEKSKNYLIAEHVETLFNGVMLQFSKRLELNEHDRITLYIHDGVSHFVPCGRYSQNPNYAKKGRPQYPDKEGCIGHGWANGWHFDNAFGRTINHHKNRCMTIYGFTEAAYQEVGMKSKLYAVMSLKDRASGNPVAVLVVESLRSDKFTEAEIKSKLVDQEDYLAEIVIRLNRFIPTVQQAKSRGL